MADGEAEADALERLEAALDRIAARAEPRGARPMATDTTAVAARLDRLIAQLQDALADATSPEARFAQSTFSDALGGEA